MRTIPLENSRFLGRASTSSRRARDCRSSAGVERPFDPFRGCRGHGGEPPCESLVNRESIAILPPAPTGVTPPDRDSTRSRRVRTKEVELLLPPQSAGRGLVPVDLLALQPVDRALTPLVGDRDFQLGMPHHDPRQSQPGRVVPGFRRELPSDLIAATPRSRPRASENPRVAAEPVRRSADCGRPSARRIASPWTWSKPASRASCASSFS